MRLQIPSGLLLTLLTTCCLFTGLSAQDPEVVMHAPDQTYYHGQVISVACSGSNLEGPNSIKLGIISSTDPSMWLVDCGCVYTAGRETWLSDKGSDDLSLREYFTASDCAENGHPTTITSLSMTVGGTVQKSMAGTSMFCQVVLGGVETVKSAAKMITSVYVGPTSLNITVTPDNGREDLVVGEGVTVLCSSDTDTSPPSTYGYFVLRKGSEALYLPRDTNQDGVNYTVDQAGDIEFKCVDTVHAHPTWTGGNTEILSSVLLPIYLSVNGMTRIPRTLNPTHSNSLTCDVSTNKKDSVEYSWTRGGITLSDDTRIIFVSNGTEGADDITCTASLNDYDLSSEIEWTITWDAQATTTAAAVLGDISTNPTSHGLVIGLVVAAVVVLVVVVLAVVLCWRKSIFCFNSETNSGGNELGHTGSGGKNGGGTGNHYDSNDSKPPW